MKKLIYVDKTYFMAVVLHGFVLPNDCMFGFAYFLTPVKMKASAFSGEVSKQKDAVRFFISNAKCN